MFFVCIFEKHKIINNWKPLALKVNANCKNSSIGLERTSLPFIRLKFVAFFGTMQEHAVQNKSFLYILILNLHNIYTVVKILFSESDPVESFTIIYISEKGDRCELRFYSKM